MKEQLVTESDGRSETQNQAEGLITKEATQPDPEVRTEEVEVEDLSVDPFVFMQRELTKKGIVLRRSPYRPGMEVTR